MKQGPPNVTQQLTAQCPLWKPRILLPKHETRTRIDSRFKIRSLYGLVWGFSRHVALDCVLTFRR
jgi:hypothetical protein